MTNKKKITFLFRLTALDVYDQELQAILSAKNNLESFIYEMRDKLEHDSHYKAAVTSEEATAINEKLSEVDAWMSDEGYDADVKVNSLNCSIGVSS